MIVAIVSMIVLLAAVSQWSAAFAAGLGTFQWPLSPFTAAPNVTQDYACKGANCYSTDKYHTGIDMTSTTSDQGVYASEAGTVVSPVVNDCDPGLDCNGGWGNVVLIQHDTGLYSMYAHMQKGSVVVAVGDTVFKGQKIGVMGNTGRPDYGVHLHFEVKSGGTLGPGYTVTPPDVNGYFDPWKYIASTHINPVPVKVVNGVGLNVRGGPGTNCTACSSFTTVDYDQRYVALAQSGEWYRVYLPCSNSSCAGWIARMNRSCAGGICSQEDPTATQVEVRNTGTLGLLVRPSPDGSPPLDKMWDGQRLVSFGSPQFTTSCPSEWYQLYLPASSGAAKGWSCGDWLTVISGAGQPGSQTYSFSRGLNLISFPFAPIPSRFSEIFSPLDEDLFPYVFYLRDTGDIGYGGVGDLNAQAKKGYFLFLENPRAMAVNGNAVTPGVTLRRGLNLVGVTSRIVPQSNGNVYPYAFYLKDQVIQAAALFQDGLDRGVGYFIFSNTDGNVLIPDGAIAAAAMKGSQEVVRTEAARLALSQASSSTTIGDDFVAEIRAQQQGSPNSPVLLKFGVKPGASDGWDESIDHLRDIPMPGQLVAFIDEGFGLSQSYKASGNSKEWLVVISSQSSSPGSPDNGNPVLVSWTIPTGGTVPVDTHFQLLDANRNVVVSDKKITTETSFNVGAPSTQMRYILRAFVDSLPPSFGYDLSNGGPITVTAGGSGNTTITRTLVAGTPQPVTLSVSSGLPTGASVESWSSNPCSPTCSSTLRISTSTNTPAATYPITVTGSPLGRTTTFSLMVNPSPGVLGVDEGMGLTSSGPQGGPFTPASQTYTLRNTGGSTLS